MSPFTAFTQPKQPLTKNNSTDMLRMESHSAPETRLFDRIFLSLESSVLPPVIPVKRELPYILDSSTSSSDSDYSDDSCISFYFSSKKKQTSTDHAPADTESSKSLESASELQSTTPTPIPTSSLLTSVQDSSSQSNQNPVSLPPPSVQKPSLSPPLDSNQHPISSPPSVQKPAPRPLLALVRSFIASSHGSLPDSPTQQDVEFLNCCRFVEFAVKTRSVPNLRSAFAKFAQSERYCSTSQIRSAALKQPIKIKDYFGIPKIVSIYSSPRCFHAKPTASNNSIQRQVTFAICKNAYNEFDFRVLKSFILEGNEATE